jgi:hypothetical protein
LARRSRGLGDVYKRQAQERLITELKNYVDYSQPLTWIQG